MNRILNSGLVVTAVVTLLATSSTRATLAAPTSKTLMKTQLAPNARDFYKRAGEALNRDHKGFDFPPFGNNEKNATSPASWKIREAVLSRNARALSLMRQGFAFSYHPSMRMKLWDDINFTMSFNFDMRQLARLLIVESDVYSNRGEHLKAINSSLDAIRLSKDISRGSVVDSLTGSAVASMGKSQMKRSTLNKLNAVEARAAARRLENIEMRNFPYANILREEKRFGQIMLRDIFEENKWRAEYPTVKTPRQIMMTYNRVMDEAIINVSRPFPQRKTELEAADDPLSEALAGNHTSGPAATGSFQARDNTTSQMLIAMLALRAFRVERGVYPNTLNELVPNYLRRMPLDSFSNQPLRYVRKNNEYSLYSIGYDMIDDGGKALPKRLTPETTGDIVAGINVG